MAKKKTEEKVFKLAPGKPVTGLDLHRFRVETGLLIDEARRALGLTTAAWHRYTSLKTDRNSGEVVYDPKWPVPDPSVCLLVRYYSENPESVPRDRFPTPTEVWAKMKENGSEAEPETLENFGVRMGRERVSGWRWVENKGNFGGTCERLAAFWIRENRNRKGYWDNMVRREAKAQGLSDPFETGRWGVRKRKRKDETVETNTSAPKAKRPKTVTRGSSDGIQIMTVLPGE